MDTFYIRTGISRELYNYLISKSGALMDNPSSREKFQRSIGTQGGHEPQICIPSSMLLTATT